MNDTLRVLIPVDEQADGDRLLPVLLPLWDIRPLHADLLRVTATDEEHGEAGSELDRLQRLLRRRGLETHARVATGVPEKEILACARGGHHDWIVMSTHGRRGARRALFGSVTEAVLRKARAPVLVVRTGNRPGPWRHVAAALDGSRAAEAVLPEAGRAAKACGTPLQVVRACGRFERAEAQAYLDGVVRKLSAEGISSLPYVRVGAAASQLLAHAREMDLGLLCMTTHGRTGLRRAVLGSVAEDVVRRSPCPVLVRRTG